MKQRLVVLLVAVCLIAVNLPTAFAAAAGTGANRETDFFTDQYHADLDYSQMTYQRVELNQVKQVIADVRALLNDKANIDKVEEAFQKATDLFTDVATGYKLLDIKIYQNVNDQESYQERQYVQDLYMTAADELSLLVQDILASPCGGFLKRHLSAADMTHYTNYKQMPQEAHELANQELILKNQYMAAASQTFTAQYEGKTWDEETLYAALEKEDITRETYTAVLQAITEKKNAVLGNIYMELVAVRQNIAKAAGYDNYAAYAYKEIYGRDYTPAQLREYFAAVKEAFVPVASTLVSLNTLNMIEQTDSGDGIYFADYSGDVALDMIEPYIGQMSSELAEAFSYMREHGLYDTEASTTKSEAGFTTILNSYGAPFFFNAASGTIQDFSTAIHEFGHYNHYYWHPAGWNDESVGMDMAEIHSQGMELLFSHYYPQVFGEKASQANDYLLASLSQAMVSAIYSELELYVYTTQGVTLSQINQEYSRLLREYSAQGGVADGAWVSIPHLFVSPCYYISYPVAIGGAFSFWLTAQEDYFKAVDDYLRFAAFPSSISLQDSFAIMGKANPVSGNYVRQLSEVLWDKLELERRVAEEVYQGRYFNDVSYGSWYYEAVQASVVIGVMNGTGTDTFSPNDITTRSSAATVLWRLEGEPDGDGTVDFTDVPAHSWYAGAVDWVSQLGIAVGDGSSFSPNATLTREQMATMIYRYARHLGATGEDKAEAGITRSKYADGAKVSSWAVDAMNWCVGNGIIQGTDAGTLLPQTGVSRAQFATMIIRLLEWRLAVRGQGGLPGLTDAAMPWSALTMSVALK